MGILAEIKTDRVMFSYTESEETNKDYYLHCHNYYELYYFIDGDVDYLVEGRQYHLTPHSILLLTPNVFHGVKVNSTKPYLRLALHFLPDILSMERRHLLLSSYPAMEKHSEKKVYYQDPEQYRIYSFFESLIECSKLEPELQKELLPIYMEALLSQVTVMSHLIQSDSGNGSSPNTISKIIAYLNQHLTDSITLDKISEEFYISKHHLNKVFRKATGTTVGDYLLHKRIIYAQQLLINGHTASDAASESGFGDYSAFYRAYSKIIGHSPLQDRGVLPSLVK
ncbi:helix-turn-helix domain-containing protein [Anaerocolumna sedimenticola]|uniref:Helix-turn-helix domain-containing protein n=1 Tax=Anaerocolumna sedimenticola TaxID=2696063 RepID=A0A6P1TNS8_9FIRM|nr:AraC family transcriptional regulator [Anaerocolumna sedimenticola]QHQ62900.1 helix-turn-helix domain-containing protein [Anaerocolumna sedimenticola]